MADLLGIDLEERFVQGLQMPGLMFQLRLSAPAFV